MRRLLASCAAIGALLLGMLSAAPAVAADEDGALEIVFDASGSMAEATADGTTRIAAARTALDTVVRQLPVDNRVGLRAFGATIVGGASAGACTDSQLLVPIGTGNRDAIASAVAGIVPTGETPIGYALQQAGADLGTGGPRAILLVSDGLATCEPDPCIVAQELTQQDLNLRIDVIGFDVDAAARSQLQCVADRGRGDYVDVTEASGLQLALERLSTRAFRPFSVAGTTVDGAVAPESAPVLAPGTQYVDAVRGTEPLTYAIERTMPGSVLHVGLAGRLPRGDSVSLRAVLTAGETTCDQTTITATASDRFSLFSGRVSAAEPDPASTCSSAEGLRLAVEVLGAPEAEAPFELRIAEHAWPTNAAALAAPEDAARGWSMATEADGAAGALLGGSSLNDAPSIEPGSYTTEMLSSEFQFFRVAADWGQSIRVHAQIDPAVAPPENAWGIVQVLDPVGADVSAILAETDSGLVWSKQLTEQGDAIAVTTPPIRFDDAIGLVKRPVFAGEYIVAIGFSADSGEEPTPLIVTVEVVGDPGTAPDLSGTAGPPALVDEPREQTDTAAAIASVPWGVVAAFAGVGAVLIAVIALLVWFVQRRGRRAFDRY